MNNGDVEKDNLGATAAFTLASLLTTIAAICVSLLATSTDLQSQVVTLLFGFIGFLSIATSALLVDWVLDEIIEKKLTERLVYLNGGYLAFSLVMGCIAFTILETTYLTVSNSTSVGIEKHVLYAVTATFLWLKTLFKTDKGIFLILLIMFSGISFYEIISPL